MCGKIQRYEGPQGGHGSFSQDKHFLVPSNRGVDFPWPLSWSWRCLCRCLTPPGLLQILIATAMLSCPSQEDQGEWAVCTTEVGGKEGLWSHTWCCDSVFLCGFLSNVLDGKAALCGCLCVPKKGDISLPKLGGLVHCPFQWLATVQIQGMHKKF